MKLRIAGLFLALASFFAVPAFGQNNAVTLPVPSTQQAPVTKPPITLIVVTNPDSPVTPAFNTFITQLTKALAEDFTVNTKKQAAKDDATQYEIRVLAFGTTTTKDDDGKTVIPTNMIAITATLHVKGRLYPLYLFSGPLQLDDESEVNDLLGFFFETMNEADQGLSEAGGADKQ
jgi:hypothetical protein